MLAFSVLSESFTVTRAGLNIPELEHPAQPSNSASVERACHDSSSDLSVLVSDSAESMRLRQCIELGSSLLS